ncbi:hypothetical protein HEP85_17910 [Streptomyces sp. RPA4-2]|uniref:hypothetical protein n=1 Tax=Streptomyces sp. RPA4-2 TaxID=2721244 RepID=UPI00143E225E|nr:hypothetical protein [Streptomyces sp. RPA4-2]QIY63169.1 hypothetical protein HEP85_17910 [Streptomyces sp. RPA4-2]
MHETEDRACLVVEGGRRVGPYALEAGPDAGGDRAFVLTGSLGYFFVLPKRGAASSEDLDRARALFVQHLRRI